MIRVYRFIKVDEVYKVYKVDEVDEVDKVDEVDIQLLGRSGVENHVLMYQYDDAKIMSSF